MTVAVCEHDTPRSDHPDDFRLLVPVKGAAKALGIGMTTTWKLIAEGKLETRRIGCRRLVTASSIRDLAESGT